MLLIFYFALIALLLPYVLGPFLIHSKNRFPAAPTFDILEPGQLPAGVLLAFREQGKSLEFAGFSLVDYLTESGKVTKVTMYVALLTNRSKGDMALLVDMTATGGEANLHNSYVEFSTNYADGLNINTNSSSQVTAFSKTREKLTFQFPAVRDPRALYTIHRRLLANQRSRSIVKTVAEGSETHEVERSMVREMARQERLGYFYLDTAAAAYRPTWKGAVLMTWRSAWPVKDIRGILQNRTSEAALKASPLL